MSIRCRESIMVVNDDAITVSTMPAARDDRSTIGCINLGSGLRRQVDSLMHLAAAADRMNTVAEAAAQPFKICQRHRKTTSNVDDRLRKRCRRDSGCRRPQIPLC